MTKPAPVGTTASSKAAIAANPASASGDPAGGEVTLPSSQGSCDGWCDVFNIPTQNHCYCDNICVMCKDCCYDMFVTCPDVVQQLEEKLGSDKSFMKAMMMNKKGVKAKPDSELRQKLMAKQKLALDASIMAMAGVKPSTVKRRRLANLRAPAGKTSLSTAKATTKAATKAADAVVAPTCSLLVSDASSGCKKAASEGIGCDMTWSQGCGPDEASPTGDTTVTFSTLCPAQCTPNMQARAKQGKLNQGLQTALAAKQIVPTSFPTLDPTPLPATNAPTLAPALPTESPTTPPTIIVGSGASCIATTSPTNTPTFTPTFEPTFVPTATPTTMPTEPPTDAPTHMPTTKHCPVDFGNECDLTSTECVMAWESYVTCSSWKATSNCMPTGDADPSGDDTCDATIGPTQSGYCLCSDGSKAMEKGCDEGVFATCAEACSAQNTYTCECLEGFLTGSSDTECISTSTPTVAPTAVPSVEATNAPTAHPSFAPTDIPTSEPTHMPTEHACTSGTHGCDTTSTYCSVDAMSTTGYKCECIEGFVFDTPTNCGATPAPTVFGIPTVSAAVKSVDDDEFSTMTTYSNMGMMKKSADSDTIEFEDSEHHDATTITLNADGSTTTTDLDGTLTDISANGKNIKVTAPDGSITVTKVNPDGSVSITPGPSTTVASVGVNDDGSTTTTYSDGSTATVSADGKTIAVENAAGTKSITNINEDGSMTTTDSDGKTTKISADGKTTTVIFPDGSKKVTKVSDDGTVTITPGAMAAVVSTETNDDGSVTTTYSNDATSTLSADGQTIKVVDPNGGQTTTKINTNGGTTTTKPDGALVTMSVDGTVTSTTAPDGTVKTTTLNADGSISITPGAAITKVSTETNDDGSVTTTYSNDATSTLSTDGQKIVVTTPDGTVTTTNAGEDGSIVTTLADGTKTTVSADGKETLVVNNNDGGTIVTTVGDDGSVSIVNTDGSLVAVDAVAGADGSTTATLSDGTTIKVSVDGNTVTTTAPNGKVTKSTPAAADGAGAGIDDGSYTTADGSYTSDDGASTKLVSYPDGSSLSTSYDPASANKYIYTYTPPPTSPIKITAVTNANGSTTATLGDGTTISVSADGNTITTTAPDGTVIVLTKNDDGSSSKVTTSPDGATLTAIVSADGTGTVSYQPPAVPTTITPTSNSDGSSTATLADGTTVNVSADGNTVTTTAPDGTVVVSTKLADGSTTTVKTNPDGSNMSTTVGADGTATLEYQPPPSAALTVGAVTNIDGSTTCTLPDGMTIDASANGKVVVISWPNGKVAVYTTNPDGTTSMVTNYPPTGNGAQVKTVTDPSTNIQTLAYMPEPITVPTPLITGAPSPAPTATPSATPTSTPTDMPTETPCVSGNHNCDTDTEYCVEDNAGSFSCACLEGFVQITAALVSTEVGGSAAAAGAGSGSGSGSGSDATGVAEFGEFFALGELSADPTSLSTGSYTHRRLSADFPAKTMVCVATVAPTSSPTQMPTGSPVHSTIFGVSCANTCAQDRVLSLAAAAKCPASADSLDPCSSCDVPCGGFCTVGDGGHCGSTDLSDNCNMAVDVYQISCVGGASGAVSSSMQEKTSLAQTKTGWDRIVKSGSHSAVMMQVSASQSGAGAANVAFVGGAMCVAGLALLSALTVTRSRRREGYQVLGSDEGV
jgi:hypothetical protein